MARDGDHHRRGHRTPHHAAALCCWSARDCGLSDQQDYFVMVAKPAGEVLRTCGVTPQVRSTSPAGLPRIFSPAAQAARIRQTLREVLVKQTCTNDEILMKPSLPREDPTPCDSV